MLTSDDLTRLKAHVSLDASLWRQAKEWAQREPESLPAKMNLQSIEKHRTQLKDEVIELLAEWLESMAAWAQGFSPYNDDTWQVSRIQSEVKELLELLKAERAEEE